LIETVSGEKIMATDYAELYALKQQPMPEADYPVQSPGVDYSARDNEARVTFYVPLWKRKGMALNAFDDYWRDVHGPVCARLPGQFQYWQFHVAPNEGGIFPAVEGVDYTTAAEDQFDGIAELTFKSVQDRQTWFDAAAILMADEHNIFSKAVGYITKESHSKTYVDGIPAGDPNGSQGIIKFHVLVRQAEGVIATDFQRYMTDTFAANVIKHDRLLKFRLHLFEPPDVSRPDAAGVTHYEPPEKQYQAAFEIAFRNNLDMELFFASKEYAAAVKEQARYVKQVCPFPERDPYTFVYNGRMTLAGQRGSRTAELITTVGATNQLKPDIYQLIIGGNHSNDHNPDPAKVTHNFPANAVLDDKELQAGLNGINPKFGDFCTRVAGEAWGLPLIDQKTKALIAIAVDVMAQNQVGPGSPFGAHVMMAMKQGAIRAEIEEVLLFMCAYAGFNKAAGCFGVLNELLGPPN
jgi:alkylhydroperoxidase/carboxymuconolactone decarboxylase family protein YurZ